MDNYYQQTPPVQQPQQVSPVPSPIPEPSNPPAGGGWLKWVLLIVVAVIISSATTYFVLQSQTIKQATIPSPTPSPAKASATESDPTANWKTYTNTTYSFQLEYPPVFELEKLSKTSIDLVDKSKNLAAVGINPIYPSIHVYVEIGISPEEYIKGQSLTLGEKQIINGNEFLTAYSEIGGAPLFYLLKKGSNVIVIRDYLGEFDKEDYHLNQILSTFRFE